MRRRCVGKKELQWSERRGQKTTNLIGENKHSCKKKKSFGGGGIDEETVGGGEKSRGPRAQG